MCFRDLFSESEVFMKKNMTYEELLALSVAEFNKINEDLSFERKMIYRYINESKADQLKLIITPDKKTAGQMKKLIEVLIWVTSRYIDKPEYLPIPFSFDLVRQLAQKAFPLIDLYQKIVNATTLKDFMSCCTELISLCLDIFPFLEKMGCNLKIIDDYCTYKKLPIGYYPLP